MRWSERTPINIMLLISFLSSSFLEKAILFSRNRPCEQAITVGPPCSYSSIRSRRLFLDTRVVNTYYLWFRLLRPTCTYMFESLSDKLKKTLKDLRGQGRLTPEHVDAALREIRMALLEAD